MIHDAPRPSSDPSTDVMKPFIRLLMKAEICARSYDQYLARQSLSACLKEVSFDDVLAISVDHHLARIFWQAVNGLANADHPNRAFEFAVILKMVIPMRWRKGQSVHPTKRIRADLH